MPGALTETVTVYFDLTAQGGDFFTLDDPVKGVLDGTTYLLGGNVATDVTQYVRSVQINRGRDRPLIEINAGVASTVADNRLRTFDPSYAPGPYFGNIRPGKRATFTTNGVVRFDGLIDDWDFDYQVTGDSTGTFDTADALASLGAKELDEVQTSPQLPGARIWSILDLPEVQYPATRNIGTGVASLQADLVAWGTNVLNYLQLIAKCDAPASQLFAAKDGTLTFYGADHVLTAVGAPVFSDTVGGISYSGVTVDYGAELLFNRVSVDAIGFNQQTATNQASIDLYGVRSLSLPRLPLDSEFQAITLAQRIVDAYAFPLSRFATITVDLHGLETADQMAVLALDIGSAIRIIYTPNGIGTALDKFCLVEGVSETISSGGIYHQITFKTSYLTEGYSGSPFILDDAFYGVLDTAGHGVLSF